MACNQPTGVRLSCECDIRRLTPAEEVAVAGGARLTRDPCVLEELQSCDLVNARCETCQFIARHRQKLLLRAITVVFLIMELMMAFACLAVEATFEIGGTYLHFYVRNPTEKSTQYLVYTRLTYMTVSTVVIGFVPIILLSLLITSKFCVFCFMSFLLAIVGFVTYLAVTLVAFIKADMPGGVTSQFEGLAVICLLTSLLFLVHVMFEAWKFVFRTDSEKRNVC